MKLLITGDFYIPSEELPSNLSAIDLFGSTYNFFSEFDYKVVNLESPVTKHTVANIKTGPALKSSIKSLELLKDVGFNLATLANNHIMDFGHKGLLDTITALKEKEISYTGIFLEKKYKIEPIVIQIDDKNIAFINVCENEWIKSNDSTSGAYGMDIIGVVNAINQAKQKTDSVIIISHGGHEFYNLPSPRMKKMFRFFIDAGASAVVNHHPHCTSGFEVYKDAPIFYSIGNFIFYNKQYTNQDWNEGMSVALNVDNNNKIEFEIHLFKQCNGKLELEHFSETEYTNRMVYLNSLNEIIEDDSKLEYHFNQFIASKRRSYLAYLEPHKNKYLQALQNRGILPSMWTKKKRNYLLNLIRCEAHRDITINVLENEVSHT